MAYNTRTAPAAGSGLAVDTISGADFHRVKLAVGAEGAGVDVSATAPLPVSGTVAVTGVATQTTLAAILAKIIAAPATEAKQDAAIAATATIGTRAYGTAATRVAYSGTSAQSATIAATEVLLHNCGEGRCYVKAGSSPTATVNDIPLEAGEKFHLRVTSGHRVAVLQDSAAGSLNIVPVA